MAVPVRGVASSSISSAASSTPASRTPPSGEVLDLVVARGGEHLLGLGAQALADLGQQRPDATLDQVGVVGDERDGLGVELLAQDLEHVSGRRPHRAACAIHSCRIGWRRLIDACERSVRPRSTARIDDGHRVFEPFVALGGEVGVGPLRQVDGVVRRGASSATTRRWYM